MAQLMPLPLTVSCFNKMQIGFTFLVPAHLGSPEKGPLNGCVKRVFNVKLIGLLTAYKVHHLAPQTLCCVEDVCCEENLDLISSELRRVNGDNEDKFASFQMLPSATVILTQNQRNQMILSPLKTVI